MNPAVVTLGETMVALVADDGLPLDAAVGFRRFVAGAESNVAVGLSRLGHRCRWIGRLGNDAFGRTILRHLRGEGVDVVAIADPAPTGVLIRDRREAGATEVLYLRRGSAGSRIGPDDIDAGLLQGARWLHLTGITPALSASARGAWNRAAELAVAAGIPICLDPNLRRRLWSDDEARGVLRGLMPMVALLLPGEDELGVLAEGADTAARCASLLAEFTRLEHIVVKLGPAGSAVYGRGGLIATAGASPTRPIDPVGAGDAFAAGCLAGLLDGLPWQAVLDRANRCGAAAVAVPGDTDGCLRADQLPLPQSDVLR
jgi:2-dehydro-3-deoxygluconokinase